MKNTLNIVKSITKKIPLGIYGALFVGMLTFLTYFGYVIASANDVTGYACSNNIGCISLNPSTSSGSPEFAGTSFLGVTYNTATNEFGGQGYSPLVGLVDFGVSCSPAMQAAEGASASGLKCARVVNLIGSTSVQNGGWDGYIYLGGVQLAPDGIHFTGRGWDGNDTNRDNSNPSDTGVGWLTFTATLQGDVGACGTATNLVATAQPTADLCSIGTASTPTGGGSTYWSWTCTGPMGAAQCHTLDPNVGLCGTAANTLQITSPTNNLCAVGNASSVTVNGGGQWSWTCTGQNGSANPCVAYNGDMPASCGQSAATCSVGSFVPGTLQDLGGNSWSWQCVGLGSYTTTAITCNATGVTTGPLSPIYKEN
jgi:hypothetical protein